MKNRKSTSKNPAAQTFTVSCPNCENTEFHRSLSENSSIVRIVVTKHFKTVVEEIVREGKLEFSYRCSKCDATLFDSSIPRKQI